MVFYLRIGKIIKVFGIKGELKVFPTTDELRRFDKLKKVFLLKNSKDIDTATFEDIITLEVVNVKYLKNNPVIKFDKIDSIEEAEKYIGFDIYVDRVNAIDLSNNEYFIVDLIGLKVYDHSKFIGIVDDILKTKVSSILAIKLNDDLCAITKEKIIYVPMVLDFIKSIDTANGNIYIETIDGMINY